MDCICMKVWNTSKRIWLFHEFMIIYMLSKGAKHVLFTLIKHISEPVTGVEKTNHIKGDFSCIISAWLVCIAFDKVNADGGKLTTLKAKQVKSDALQKQILKGNLAAEDHTHCTRLPSPTVYIHRSLRCHKGCKTCTLCTATGTSSLPASCYQWTADMWGDLQRDGEERREKWRRKEGKGDRVHCQTSL